MQTDVVAKIPDFRGRLELSAWVGIAAACGELVESALPLGEEMQWIGHSRFVAATKKFRFLS
jgi:hypothetical protein